MTQPTTGNTIATLELFLVECAFFAYFAITKNQVHLTEEALMNHLLAMAEETTNNLPAEGAQEDVIKENEGGQIVNPKAADVEKEEEGKHKKHYAPFWNIIAWVAVILTVTAWVVLFYNDNAAMVISIPAVICSALGIHSRFRRWSITMLVASGVLLLVFILFWIAIKYVLA